MIVYKLTDGFAHDLRYEKEGYVLKAGEQSLPGWGALPALETLHDPLAAQAKEAARAAERLRKQDLRGDALAVELVNQLRTATPTQIGNYVDANVTSLASARTMLKRVLLVLALIANG